jgi:hypothetical protein
MRHSPVVACGAFIVLVLSQAGVSRVAFADGDARLGTWKLNLAKSKYDPGPAPKSQIRKWESFEGDGVKFTVETVNADGSRTTGTYSAHYDGKDYPATSVPNADTIALKRIDSYTVDVTNKKAGKVVQTSRGVVSKDGKMMTVATKGMTASGQIITNVTVFDKQ